MQRSHYKQLFACSLLAILLLSVSLSARAVDQGCRDLFLDNRGTAVTQLQTDLTRLGFYNRSIDGWFGPRTQAAVVSFQQSAGLKADGIFGPRTKAALDAALAPVPAPAPSAGGSQDLSLDSRGTAVTRLQTDLARLGFYGGSIDGWFGPRTQAAVVSFQRSAGLKADGVVGPLTGKALDTAAAGTLPPSPVAAHATSPAAASIAEYNRHEKPIVDAYRAGFDGSLAQTLVGRAIWYMEYGFMKYGHTKYASTGYIDCSNFVSLVYKDFGYSITSAAKNYGSVGVKVNGVYAEKIPGSSKYRLAGVQNLKPGDIFTFWNSDAPARTHIGHVAIYMGLVDGKPCIINTCKGHPSAIGIIDDFAYWYGSSLIEVRRVLPASAFTAGSKINAQGPVIPAQYQIKPDRPIVLPQDLAKGF